MKSTNLNDLFDRFLRFAGGEELTDEEKDNLICDLHAKAQDKRLSKENRIALSNACKRVCGF